MNPIFYVTDAKGETLNVRNISRDGYHLYQLTTVQGHYAELGFIRDLNSWTITFYPAHTPIFQYDIEEVGSLIRKCLKF